MKKFALLFLLFSFIPFTQAKEIEWKDLDKSCFLNYAKVQNSENKTVKIRNLSQKNLFFVQNNQALPYKAFEYAKEKPLSYTVLELLGEDLKETKFLQDGNFTTSVEPKNFYGKELILDAGEILKARTFRTKIDFNGQLNPRFWISDDNQDYKEVADINQFDWRYLKLTFQNYSSIDSRAYPLLINEISIVEAVPNTYLLNSTDNSNIEVYANYQCELEEVIQLKNKLNKKLNQTKFSLDAETKLYDISFKKNPTYNSDFDDDGITNESDNCPFETNPEQTDIDFDLVGDVCDFDNETQNFHDQDSDNDGVGNSLDNCPYVYNPKQSDANANGRGDLCSDDDQDGIIGEKDNCVQIPNSDQKDVNINGIGDACEFDKDEDGIFDSVDNCITLKNTEQADEDKDGIGDLCDNCELYNPRQLDKNQSGKGDICEEAEKNLEENDKDKDGIIDYKDNCKKVANADQKDTDKDGIGDECDNCPNLQNSDQADKDENKIGDFCEDSDSDGIEGYLDNCMFYANANQIDTDNDGIGDECEDDDHDGLVAAEDNCPFDYNKDQWDNDRDGVGDKCDEKDNRFIESNKYFVIGGIVFLTMIFGLMIFVMVKKLKKM